MSLDIACSFNEVDLRKHPEYASRVVKGKPFDFVDQLISLGRSAAANAPAAKLWAVHTQPLSSASAERLAKGGWTVVRRDREQGPKETDRLHDRLAAYEVGSSDVLLLLDTDTLFVRPGFPLLRGAPVRVGFAGRPVFTEEIWRELFLIADVRWPGRTDKRAFLRWFWLHQERFMPFFNNGAVLIARSEALPFRDRMRGIRDAILATDLLDRATRLGHFFDQVCLSLAVHQTPNWGLLPPGFNTLSSMINLDNPFARRRISHYHYLTGVDEAKMLKRYGRFF